MNIAYIGGSVLPSRQANTVHIMKMSQAMAREGHEVTLVSKQGSHLPDVNDIFGFYNVEPVFEIEQAAFPKIEGRSIIHAIAAAKAVHRLKPDLVYGRYVHACALTAWMGYPTIFECHQPIWQIGSIHHAFFEFLRRSSSFRKLVLITDALKEVYLDKKDMDPRQIFVAHDAAEDPGDIEPVKLEEARQDALQVGYVGSLYSGKGMEVVSEVAPSMPDIDFHVVGGTDDDIAKWRLRIDAENLYFHGFVSQEEVSRYMAALDICLLPNQRSVAVYGSDDLDIGRYTSPLKMFEYMSHGKPIIASNLPVLRDVLQDRKNALLCDPENPDEWKKALRSLEENECLQRRLGAEAQKDFEDRYTWQARARRVLKAFVPTNIS